MFKQSNDWPPMPSRSYLFPQSLEHLVAISEGVAGRFEYKPSITKEAAPRYAPLITVDDLPILLGISPSIIGYFLRKPAAHYRVFEIEKRSGGTRTISSPRTWLKVTQWWIYENIMAVHDYADCAYGFVRGRGPKENAEFHLGANHILNMDVRNFFPSIGVRETTNVFLKLGYSASVSSQLASLCTLDDELPQGAPTSPSISNIYMENFDQQMLDLANKNGWKYSRYADDITLSSTTPIDQITVKEIAEILGEYGLQPNAKKTKFMDRSHRMEVTGFVINDKVQLPRTWRKLARAKIHRFLNGGETDFDWHHIVGLFGAISNQQDANNTKLYEQAKIAAQKGKPR